MIIHKPVTFLENGMLSVTTRVETQYVVPHLPERLEFRFPAYYSPWVNQRSDGFVSSLLMLSMYLNEPLDVRGTVSPRLIYGLREWQHIFHAWLPDMLSVVDILVENVSLDFVNEKPTGIGTAFSGGVDSMYTLWAHLPENQPSSTMRITHGLYLHGFDINPYDAETYQMFYQPYQKVFQDLGLDLIWVWTNAVNYYQFRIGWEFAHGGPLIGAALMLNPLLKCFYVPATFEYIDIESQGTSPLTDHWLSTESMEIIHHGASLRRSEKLALLAQWDIARKSLHVCARVKSQLGTNNCGACFKCLRDMAILDIHGSLVHFSTFKKGFRAVSLYKLLLSHPSPWFRKEFFELAVRNRRWDIALPAFMIWVWGGIKKRLLAIAFKFVSKKYLYSIKRRVYRRQSFEKIPD